MGAGRGSETILMLRSEVIRSAVRDEGQSRKQWTKKRARLAMKAAEELRRRNE